MTTLNHVHELVRRAVSQAVEKAVTIRWGVVTGVSVGSIAVALDDGSVHPKVSVLGPYTPRTGDSVRLAFFGGQVLALGGAGVPLARTAWAGDTNVTASVTSTALAPLPAAYRVGFTAPRSGAVVVHTRARLTPTATARATFAARITRASDGAVMGTDAAPVVDVPAGGSATAAGGASYFTGLTPGTTYWAEFIAATGVSGQTITVQNPRVLVQPVP